MPIRRRTLIRATATLALTLPLSGCGAQGIVVSVTNTGSAPLTAIEVRYTGGTIRVPARAPNASHHARVAATGESLLDMRFVDANGARRSETVGVFFEPGYTGSVAILVDDAGVVTWRDRVRV